MSLNSSSGVVQTFQQVDSSPAELLPGAMCLILVLPVVETETL